MCDEECVTFRGGVDGAESTGQEGRGGASRGRGGPRRGEPDRWTGEEEPGPGGSRRASRRPGRHGVKEEPGAERGRRARRRPGRGGQGAAWLSSRVACACRVGEEGRDVAARSVAEQRGGVCVSGAWCVLSVRYVTIKIIPFAECRITALGKDPLCTPLPFKILNFCASLPSATVKDTQQMFICRVSCSGTRQSVFNFLFY
jgi:hypothetical protein